MERKGRVMIAVSDTGSPISRGGKEIRLKDSGFTTGVKLLRDVQSLVVHRQFRMGLGSRRCLCISAYIFRLCDCQNVEVNFRVTYH